MFSQMPLTNYLELGDLHILNHFGKEDGVLQMLAHAGGCEWALG